MITTTLNRIHEHSPCAEGWGKLLAGLGKTKADDEPLPYRRIVEINGIDDALWACRAEPQHEKEWRLFAVWCAREATKYTNDWRSVQAINVAERYAHGMATESAWVSAREAATESAWVSAREAASASAWVSAREDQMAKFIEITS